MPNSYKITIKNETGGKQNYHFFSAQPVVSGGSYGSLWSNVMKVANNTPNGGSAMLDVARNYYAVCGSFDGSPAAGGSITISKSVPISLGAKNGANVTKGSTVNLIVNDQSACDYGPPTTPGEGKLGSFQVDTSYQPGNEFTMQDSKDNNLLIGIASSKDSNIKTAMGSFMPYPNVKYQIQPQAVFYVAAGESFDAGALVKVEMMASTMAVDFNARGTNDVVLVHGSDMLFTFE
ncbi:hypothetical protein E4U55_002898 [Claviceps digitariae]|nr:hypothetical protein E4U55_002898 [Claviceps digitariae]